MSETTARSYRPQRDPLGQLHLMVGLAALLVFVGTGAWMHFKYDHLRGMTDATRLLFRSTHIYLLFAALLNLAIGAHHRRAVMRGARLLQGVGSVLLLATPLLFLAGFLSEPWLGDLQRPWSRPGIYASLAGTLLHLVARERA
ncbi:MAG: hypothetical protein ABR551_13445 [Gemmatimonadales bacterium]